MNTRISFKVQGQQHVIESSDVVGGIDTFYKLLENVTSGFDEGEGTHIDIGTTFTYRGDQYKVVNVSTYYSADGKGSPYTDRMPFLDIRYIVTKH